MRVLSLTLIPAVALTAWGCADERADAIALVTPEVRAAQAEEDAFMAPLRHLSAEYVWGSVWARPGLAEKTRRLINLAMLAAVNR